MRRWIPNSAESLGRLATGLVFAISALVLVGQTLQLKPLTSPNPQWHPMSVPVAICFLLAAVGLALIQSRAPVGPKVLLAPAVLIGSAALWEIAPYAIEAAGPGTPLPASLWPPGSRVPPLTAILFVLSAGALALLAGKSRRGADIAHGLTLPIAASSYLILLSHMLDVPELSGLLHRPVALYTGVAFGALSLGLFCARTETWFTSVFIGDQPGSIAARKLLPFLLALPVVISWARLEGERHGLFSSDEGVAWVALLYALGLLAIAWARAISVNRSEGQLDRARRQMDLLAATAAQLLSFPDPLASVNGLCRKVMEVIDCQLFFNFLADEKAGRLHLNACAGVPEETARSLEWLEYGAAVCGCVARDGEPVVAERVQTSGDPRAELVRSLGAKAYACFPLRSKRGILGTLSFGTRNRERFSPSEIALMRTVADQVSIAVIRKQDEDSLRLAHDRLESKVRERTRALEQANRSLQDKISELQQADEALLEEQRRSRAALDRMPTYVVILTPDHRVLFANKVFRERFGEHKGRRCFEALFGRKEPCEVCETYKVLDTKAPHRWEWTGPDGRVYEVFDTPMADKDGSPLIMEIGLDISQRKQAETELEKHRQHLEDLVRERTAACDTAQEAMRQAHDYLESLLNHANAPIICWDAGYRITRFNHAFERLTGYKQDEVLGRALSMLFPEDSREASLKEIQRTLLGEHWDAVEIPILRKDGEVRVALWNSANIYSHDGKAIQATIAQGQDITERKEAEAVLRRDKETFSRLVQERTQKWLSSLEELEKAKRLADIGALSATVAHELRNPLAAMKMAAYNIRRKVPDAAIANHLANIDKKIAESDQIINNLLFYSRTKMPKYEAVRLAELLDECIEAAQERFPNHVVSVKRRLDRVRGLVIQADPLQMKELFGNILDNAYDALPALRGAILVTAGPGEEEKMVRISIRDDGSGMDSEGMGKAFEPFFTTKSKGTGLGLSVCSQIVRLHGGSIELKSEDGLGTEVLVTLPAERLGYVPEAAPGR